MSTPAVERWRTARTAARRRTEFGEYHTATWAAFARVRVAWGSWRGLAMGRAPMKLDPMDSATSAEGVCMQSRCNHAYTTADLRARGVPGFDNRHERKRKRRKFLKWAGAQGYTFKGVIK